MNSESAYASWSQLPAEAKDLFLQATEQWDDRAASESFVEQALARFGDDLEVLVSAYRFFFYRSRPERGLALARCVLEHVRRGAKLPETWAELEPLLAADTNDATLRLYLAAYSASGLLLAQLGEFDEARVISRRVQALDDRREYLRQHSVRGARGNRPQRRANVLTGGAGLTTTLAEKASRFH